MMTIKGRNDVCKVQIPLSTIDDVRLTESKRTLSEFRKWLVTSFCTVASKHRTLYPPFKIFPHAWNYSVYDTGTV